MGKTHKPDKVKVITGLISRDTALFDISCIELEKVLGKVDYKSDILDFTHTEYYKTEMGGTLKRQFLSFDQLFDLDGLGEIKTKTNQIEQKFLDGDNRKINIDPGYVDLAKLVLFSTKDYSHRLYAGNNIFAEVTLYYKDGSFQPWPWTYPDYRTKEYIDIFNSIRDKYRAKAKS